MQRIIKYILLGTCWVTMCSAQQLPDLGDYSSRTLSSYQETKLGFMLMQQIRQQMPLLSDPSTNSYINSIGYRLVSHTKHNGKFHFYIVRDHSINAFSAPGGYVVINSGLVLTTRTESELAAVLAHEIAHVNQHHIARALTHAKKMTLPSMAALLAAILVGTQTNTNVTSGAIAAVMGGRIQSMISYTRANEKEADRMGMQTLYKSGFNPNAMPNFLTRMQKASFYITDSIPAFLQDHPTTVTRIADTENRARLYPKRNVKSSMDYFLFRARIRALTTSRHRALQYFSSKLKKHNYQSVNATKYGYALALARNKNYTKAIKITKQLIKSSPYESTYEILLANLMQHTKHPKMALRILKKNISLFPEHYPLIANYAHLLIRNSEYKVARAFLIKEIDNFPNKNLLLFYLAKSQAKVGNLTNAYQTQAKLYAKIGNYRLAIIQLQQALKQKPDGDVRAAISSRVKMLKREYQQAKAVQRELKNI
ncbi:MAG: M48 family metallopeptidase [Gammaproteobacteria bacterium]|nr:M48 family metallopeptidase [Gammaproteobacteria bacterium]